MQTGLGVLINRLRGNQESAKTCLEAIGKKIVALSLGEDDDALHFVFEDGSKIKIFDNGQSCCESRYMRTDDNLSDFVGSVFMGGEIADAPDDPDRKYNDESHEVQFLHITTSTGVFTLSSHNEHNGYYGGFSIEVVKE